MCKRACICASANLPRWLALHLHGSHAPTQGLRDIELRTQRAKTMDVTTVYHSLCQGGRFLREVCIR